MSASVPASSISQSATLKEKVIEWVYFTLPQTITLRKGAEYTLTFSAGSSADYFVTSTIRTDWNMPSKNDWNNARAEYSTGGEWQRFRNDYPDGEGDLMLVFTIEGKPKISPL